jgi:hypothetical protein
LGTCIKGYDDKVCWALASKEKVDELAVLDDNGGAIFSIRKKLDFYEYSINAHKSGFFLQRLAP